MICITEEIGGPGMFNPKSISFPRHFAQGHFGPGCFAPGRLAPTDYFTPWMFRPQISVWGLGALISNFLYIRYGIGSFK